jgi:hypothetical protein
MVKDHLTLATLGHEPEAQVPRPRKPMRRAPSASDIVRFKSRLQLGDEAYPGLGPCLLWSASKDKDGYGKFWFSGRDIRAHRFAFLVNAGYLPENVLHRCDRPGCCEPTHLFCGTIADNNRDAAIKGRTAKGERSGWRTKPEAYIGTRPCGDANGARRHPERIPRGKARSDVMTTRRLDEAAVLRIVELLRSGMSQRQTARLFGVTRPTIQAISDGRGWAWLTHGEVVGRRLPWSSRSQRKR